MRKCCSPNIGHLPYTRVIAIHYVSVSPEPWVQLILFSHSGHTRKVAKIGPPQWHHNPAMHSL